MFKGENQWSPHVCEFPIETDKSKCDEKETREKWVTQDMQLAEGWL